MTEYLCRFELDIEADSPEEAAREMWYRMKDYWNWQYLPVIEVEDPELLETEIDPKPLLIDLDAIGEGDGRQG